MTIKKNHGSFRSNTNRSYPSLATKQTLPDNIPLPQTYHPSSGVL
jgi:hypothetical protein